MFTRPFRCRWHALLAVLAIGWAQMAGAQQPGRSFTDPRPQRNAPAVAATRAEADDDRLVARTYEVGDLILRIQDHPYSESLQQTPRAVGGGVGGGGGGIFAVPDRGEQAGHFPIMQLELAQFGGGRGGGGGVSGGGGGMAMGGGLGMGATTEPPAASITIEDLIRVLTSTVVRDSWMENGGEGQVEPLGTALVVSQNPAIHEQIKELLNQLRESTAERRTVTIDARWLLLSSDELDSMLQDDDGVPQVDTEKLAAFTRRPDSMRGITNCFSSQLVYLVSGTRRNIVSGYIPVVGALDSLKSDEQFVAARKRGLFRLVADQQPVSDKAVGYQPIVETSNFGALLEIRPTITPGRSATVDLKSTVTGPGERMAEADQGDGAALAPQVDRVAVEVVEFATSLRMPLGKPILVGGLSYAPAPVVPRGEGAESDETKQWPADGSRQLYLVLEVR